MTRASFVSSSLFCSRWHVARRTNRALSRQFLPFFRYLPSGWLEFVSYQYFQRLSFALAFILPSVMLRRKYWLQGMHKCLIYYMITWLCVVCCICIHWCIVFTMHVWGVLCIYGLFYVAVVCTMYLWFILCICCLYYWRRTIVYVDAGRLARGQ